MFSHPHRKKLHTYFFKLKCTFRPLPPFFGLKRPKIGWKKVSHFGKKLHTLGKNFILWEKTSHFGKKLHTLGMNFTVHSGKNFTLWEITSHFGNELHTSLPVFLWPFWPFLALKAVFELKHSLVVGIPVKM